MITGLNWAISRRALSGDPRDKLIRDMAIGLTSVGGTRFDNADLTDANFSKATLKSTHFKAATVRRTCFHLSKQLHLSRGYKTLLANRTALNLVVSLRPEPNTAYAGLNLKGANLAHANLADLDLTETDLSDATLEGADLQRTTLTKVQALGTNFHQANLTAACVESWNLDSTTQLAGALCEHVYLLRNQQERRPNSGIFEPGEFSELFEEVLNTIDLIFRDGMDWQAFVQTFQTIQVEHQGADLEIQSIEKKGNGVMVVRLNTHPNADKPVIHGAFKQEYELKLAAVEQEYKILLASKEQALSQKEEIIELYRQKSADMTTIAQSLAQRPVTVDVKAVANSKTGDE
ncbi:MAG: pentapeptide repeat-containing protein, partial [Cyanobacteria bacterium J06649_5]